MESRQDWRAALHESELASPVLGCRCYTVKWETVENLLWSLAVSSTLQFTRTSVRWSFASFRLLPNFSKKKKKRKGGLSELRKNTSTSVLDFNIDRTRRRNAHSTLNDNSLYGRPLQDNKTTNKQKAANGKRLNDNVAIMAFMPPFF